MKSLHVVLFFITMVFACSDHNFPEADAIINKSIEVSGGKRFEHSTIDFDFRDRHYKAIRDKGYFLLTRTTLVGSDTIVDALNSKDDFIRYRNQKKIQLHDTMAVKYKSSVNAVHYFSVLPYRLNDDAVNKTYIGKTKINDKEYHKIKVTFNAEGGGEDFEDVFVYWINADTFKADYIAYSYAESDGIGYRFREAYNERYINGIRFVDYNNYKPKGSNIDLMAMDRLFEQKALHLLSKVELININVQVSDY
ncbi:DUF6503 family protein [Aestuariivivens sediminis]|uniref:DUF6503 family protein n=1 Tax=Aestuariivivens sediminis TaxID=2913557 RepID=UPI001F5A01CC|nr:DUF6503 family protein [Aestuariivivens sediminis]